MRYKKIPDQAARELAYASQSPLIELDVEFDLAELILTGAATVADVSSAGASIEFVCHSCSRKSTKDNNEVKQINQSLKFNELCNKARCKCSSKGSISIVF